MSIALPRLTFRMHDNPLLIEATNVVVVIERERFPTEEFHGHGNWGFQQFNLLLRTLDHHQKDLEESGRELYVCYVLRAELAEFYTVLKNQASSFATDRMIDPIYAQQDQAMNGVFGDKLQKYMTFTLLDWSEPRHSKVINKYFKTARPFSKLTPIKQYVIDHMQSVKMHRVGSVVQSSKLSGLSRWIVDLKQEINKTASQMQNLGMIVHEFTNSTGDEQLLRHAEQAVHLIDGDEWYKPDTAIGLSWGKQSCLNGKDTSQLSPFLSIGSLSPKWFWQTIRTGNTNMGSAKDQLLFRECFNAIGFCSNSASDGRLSEFWSDSMQSEFLDPKSHDYPWKQQTDVITKWQNGELEGDAGLAMKELWTYGWIHHLQRHLVADTLTRGKLQQKWTEGMNWFRYTLLDHDAAVNRANWMWLSATAFSSKQKVYHYGINYVRRGTPKEMKAIERNEQCKNK